MKVRRFLLVILMSFIGTFIACDGEYESSSLSGSEKISTEEGKANEELGSKADPDEMPENNAAITQTGDYTFIEMHQTMYAKQGVNIRALPCKAGEKVGVYSKAQEVIVTGQCVETNWYRVDYKGETAYVSNNYVVAEKPETEIVQKSETVVNQPSDTIVQSENENSIVSNNNETSNSASNSGTGSGVTVPETEDTQGNLVWVPVNGGTKYHTHAGCSGMIDPMQVTLEHAKQNGYTPCKRCH